MAALCVLINGMTLTAVSPIRLKGKEHAFNPEKMLVNPKRLLRPRAFSHPTF